MRVSFAALCAAAGLAACSPQLLVPRDAVEVSTDGFMGLDAAEVAQKAGIENAEDYLDLPLTAGSHSGRVTLALVPWSIYRKAEAAGTAGDLESANLTDLLALQSDLKGRAVLTRYKAVCAPTALKEGENHWPVISDGRRVGIFSDKGCEWALVVTKSAQKPPGKLI